MAVRLSSKTAEEATEYKVGGGVDAGSKLLAHIPLRDSRGFSDFPTLPLSPLQVPPPQEAAAAVSRAATPLARAAPSSPSAAEAAAAAAAASSSWCSSWKKNCTENASLKSPPKSQKRASRISTHQIAVHVTERGHLLGNRLLLLLLLLLLRCRRCRIHLGRLHPVLHADEYRLRRMLLLLLLVVVVSRRPRRNSLRLSPRVHGHSFLCSVPRLLRAWVSHPAMVSQL